MIFAARKKVLPETKRERATEQLSETDIVKRVVDYVTSGFNVARFNMCERGEISRETFADEIKTYIKNNYYVSKASTFCDGYVVQKNTEFITAHAVAVPERTEGFLNYPCTFHYIVVSLFVSEAVIAFFEIVQVEHDDDVSIRLEILVGLGYFEYAVRL